MPYRIALCGFSEFEYRAMRFSFQHPSGRPAGYEVVDALAEADFAVVDADSKPAVKGVLLAGYAGRSVFVGSTAPAGAVAHLPRPIDTSRILRTLDELVPAAAVPVATAAAPAAGTMAPATGWPADVHGGPPSGRAPPTLTDEAEPIVQPRPVATPLARAAAAIRPVPTGFEDFSVGLDPVGSLAAAGPAASPAPASPMPATAAPAPAPASPMPATAAPAPAAPTPAAPTPAARAFARARMPPPTTPASPEPSPASRLRQPPEPPLQPRAPQPSSTGAGGARRAGDGGSPAKAAARANARRARLAHDPSARTQPLREVLVLGPDGDTNRQLCTLLERFGFAPMALTTLRQAEKLLLDRATPFAAAYLDMPLDASVLALVGSIRALPVPPPHPEPAVYLITTALDPADRVRIALAGLPEPLVKPLDRGAVAGALEKSGIPFPADARRY